VDPVILVLMQLPMVRRVAVAQSVPLSTISVAQPVDHKVTAVET
jgi:hypothetical protein